MKIVEYIRDLLNPPSYRLEGECLKCGKCCKTIYSLDDYSEKDFKLTQFFFKAYRRFKIKGFHPDGHIVLECSWLKDDNTCKDYKNRLELCKKFPNVRYGSLGKLPEGCGYKLIPISNFADILEEEQVRLDKDNFIKRFLRIIFPVFRF